MPEKFVLEYNTLLTVNFIVTLQMPGEHWELHSRQSAQKSVPSLPTQEMHTNGNEQRW